MSQTSSTPFRPIAGSAVSLAITSTTGNVAIPTVALGATSMRMVFTVGTADARVRTGVGVSTAAVATDSLIKNNTIEVIGINANDTYVAAKTDAGTCTMEFSFGFGS